MAHKTLISGTAYSVTGGRELIDGTGYGCKAGKTLIGGTAFTVPFFEGHSPEHHHPRRDPVPERIRQPRAVLYRQARLRKRAERRRTDTAGEEGLLRTNCVLPVEHLQPIPNIHCIQFPRGYMVRAVGLCHSRRGRANKNLLLHR